MYDDFTNKFFSRIPADIAATFSEQQLMAVKMAFGGRVWGAHWVDIRRSLPLPGSRLYVVLLMGREHRSPDRLKHLRVAHPLWTLANALVITSIIMVIALGILGLLYTMKNAMGLNLMPGLDVLPDHDIQQLLPWFTN